MEEAMPAANTVFWDNGGVILTNGWDRAGRKAAVEKFKLDWEDFSDRHELMLNAFEIGQISLDEYLQRVVFYRKQPFTKDDFRNFMFELSQPFPESLEYLGKLVGTGRYLMMSLNNESREINEYRIETFDLQKYFKAFLCSAYLGIRKPEPKIYKMALQIAGRRADECVFVDDRGLNLEAARELGMHTVQYKSVGQLRDDLARYGVKGD
jgi:putative hydrolase of the HAD superfamily